MCYHAYRCLCRGDTGTVLDISSSVYSEEISPLLDASEQMLHKLWLRHTLPTEMEGQFISLHVNLVTSVYY